MDFIKKNTCHFKQNRIKANTTTRQRRRAMRRRCCATEQMRGIPSWTNSAHLRDIQKLERSTIEKQMDFKNQAHVTSNNKNTYKQKQQRAAAAAQCAAAAARRNKCVEFIVGTISTFSGNPETRANHGRNKWFSETKKNMSL